MSRRTCTGGKKHQWSRWNDKTESTEVMKNELRNRLMCFRCGASKRCEPSNVKRRMAIRVPHPKYGSSVVHYVYGSTKL